MFNQPIEEEKKEAEKNSEEKEGSENPQLINQSKELEQLSTQVKKLEDQLPLQFTKFKGALDTQSKQYEYQLESQTSEIKMQFMSLANKLQSQLADQISAQTKIIEEKLEKQSQEFKKLQQQIHEICERQGSIEFKSRPNSIKETESKDMKTDENLEIIEDIGVNTRGKVMKVYQKKMYVLKKISIAKTNPTNIQIFINNYQNLKMFKHPNILDLCDSFYDNNEKDQFSILFEYCPLNLDTAIKNKLLSKVQIVCAIYQIVEGMRYIHSRKVVHGDLKPSNILITKEGIIKIGDVGITNIFSTQEQLMTGETQKFIAPEIINEEEWNENVDIYSFGILIYFLLSNGQTPNIKIRDICLGQPIEIPSTFTSLAHQLIEACLSFNPGNRPSFAVIYQELEKVNFDLLGLSSSESNDAGKFIMQHKERIPSYPL